MGKELVLIEQRKEAGDEAQQAELHNHEISSQLGKLGAMAAYLDNGQQEHFFSNSASWQRWPPLRVAPTTGWEAGDLLFAHVFVAVLYEPLGTA